MLHLFETHSGTFYYHLREDAGEPKFGGAVTVMLCGETVRGWDTKLSLECWGQKSHLNERFCSKCGAAYAEYQAKPEAPASWWKRICQG